MHIVLLSEHGEPLIGGATHLTRKIAESISSQGHTVSFVVPNSNSSSNAISQLRENFTLVKIKAFVPIDDRSRFKGANRKAYALQVSEYLKELHDSSPIDIIQILSGMYLMRHLDVPFFRNAGVKCIAGLLNIPPEECGLSWKGDSSLHYYKDELRKLLIRKINRNRIRFHQYDAYTVESDHVRKALAKYVRASSIHYIPLGTDESEPRISQKPKGGRIRILTAGGINPSKNQHIIPAIARKLADNEIKFVWHIIGPDRNTRYTQFLRSEILNNKVEELVHLIPGVPKNELMKYYGEADIYVQTSIEEGFCMTALDAVIFGLPLVGIATGAIAEFIEKGRGVLVRNNVFEFVQAIKKILENPGNYIYGVEEIKPVLEFYNWEKIGKEYISLYEELLKEDQATLKQATGRKLHAS